MKKKIMSILLASTIAVTALGLTACNDDTGDGIGDNSENSHKHSYISYVYNDDATCSNDGTETSKCEYCEETDTRVSEEHPATGEHEFEGYTCNICGEYAPNTPVTAGLKYEEIVENGVAVGYSVNGRGEAEYSDIIIPKTYNNKPVTSIGYHAFAGCVTTLTSIVIPNSVTSIGEGAFLYCNSLASIEIPYSVTSIGLEAFYCCSILTNIKIPYGVESLEEYVFNGCVSLASIEIPDSVTSIEDAAFSHCSSLTSIEIPNSVTSIGSTAFFGCSSLTSIEIPNGVTSIMDGTFNGCSNLTSIEIPNSVTSIEESAFYNCSSLTSIELPGGVTSIEQRTFYNCRSLTSIEIPDGVTSIGLEAFYRCNSLESITIPSNVTSIDGNAFYECNSLMSINFGGTVKKWKAIYKGFTWNKGTAQYTVTCTDGLLTKSESE